MKLLDVVATLEDVPGAHLAKGQVGTIVDELNGDVVLVEFADLGGVAYAVEPIHVRQLIDPKGNPRHAKHSRKSPATEALYSAPTSLIDNYSDAGGIQTAGSVSTSSAAMVSGPRS